MLRSYCAILLLCLSFRQSIVIEQCVLWFVQVPCPFFYHWMTRIMYTGCLLSRLISHEICIESLGKCGKAGEFREVESVDTVTEIMNGL